MKKKILTLLITGIMISAGASAQTIKDNIDKLAKDKETKERAAKADVLIHKKTISYPTQTDSANTKVVPVKTVIKTPGVSKVKHKKYKDKVKLKKTSK